MKVKNNDSISAHIKGGVRIRYSWNLNSVNNGMLAIKYAGLKKKPAKKDIIWALRTYRVMSGVL